MQRLVYQVGCQQEPREKIDDPPDEHHAQERAAAKAIDAMAQRAHRQCSQHGGACGQPENRPILELHLVTHEDGDKGSDRRHKRLYCHAEDQQPQKQLSRSKLNHCTRGFCSRAQDTGGSGTRFRKYRLMAPPMKLMPKTIEYAFMLLWSNKNKPETASAATLATLTKVRSRLR